MYSAFISYSHIDKHVAGQIKYVLKEYEIESFLAHEDIEVSEEWKSRILKEIRKSDIFICLLSDNFYKSKWCIQELGIAAFRKKMIKIPLSIDGNIPEGFMDHLQSIKIDLGDIRIRPLLPGLMKTSFPIGIKIITDIIGHSGSFRSAEKNFELILPYIKKMNDQQIKLLFDKIIDNNQIYDAALCVSRYIPDLLKSHGHLLKTKDLHFLLENCDRYM